MASHATSSRHEEGEASAAAPAALLSDPPQQPGSDDDGGVTGGDGTSAPAKADQESASPESRSSVESGEASPVAAASKAVEQPGAPPPLPNEPPPASEDDGWDYHWDEANQAYYFHNRITGESTWENPRLRSTPAVAAAAVVTSSLSAAPGTIEPPKNERPPAGGYNPAIHGDYDPNAWYAKGHEEENTATQTQPVDPAAAYAAIGSFNRFTGRWQGESQNPDQHNDENKSRRQMNAYFDVDAAANSHNGRSLKAERSGKKPSKTELKQFKEKRRAKKEEKRRAWLLD
ncbi:uncharacterized protein JN550_006595 [Neoarthrinium moseri]|uniref:uncharacterized protein n=1 Tax=Neoarthrinium moseri TaxID=1658444 RepID=UPI001FDBF9FC|nr:uncharacterized protein JN550_006595 [Neoarthrinium moseri]KAI1868107.1 hypothetical protein JN550_006595 [Neoarthrinium moseri]